MRKKLTKKSTLTKEEVLTESPLRKLARSDEWQVLYRNAKELNGIQLFENNKNFTAIQIEFLKWLSIYDGLYTDIQMGKENINERIIEDHVRVEAYLLLRRKRMQDKKDNQKKQYNKTQNKNSRQVHPNDIPTVVFE